MRMLSAAVLLMAGISAAQAESCTEYRIITERLDTKYHETKRVAAISGSGLLEIWVNDDNTSFTVIFRKTANIACMVSAGKNIVFLTKRVKPPGKKM